MSDPKPDAPSEEARAIAERWTPKEYRGHVDSLALAIDAHSLEVWKRGFRDGLDKRDKDAEVALAKKDEALRGALAYIKQSHDIGDREAWVVAVREALDVQDAGINAK